MGAQEKSNMATQSQKPARSHAKNISIISTTEVVNKVEGKATRRRDGKEFGAGNNSGVPLEPQPSESPEDPLVYYNLLLFDHMLTLS